MSFGALQTANGDGGNYRTGPYEPQFDPVWANIKSLNGGEEVMAGRLTGYRTVLITVRYSSNTASVTSEWSARNEHTGETFNVLEAKDPDSKRMWIEVLARYGVAGGGIPGEVAP